MISTENGRAFASCWRRKIRSSELIGTKKEVFRLVVESAFAREHPAAGHGQVCRPKRLRCKRRTTVASAPSEADN